MADVLAGPGRDEAAARWAGAVLVAGYRFGAAADVWESALERDRAAARDLADGWSSSDGWNSADGWSSSGGWHSAGDRYAERMGRRRAPRAEWAASGDLTDLFEAAALARAAEGLLGLDVRVLDSLGMRDWWAARMAQRAGDLRWPGPTQRDRGALADLRPLVGLLLAAIDTRWRRDEPSLVLALVHLLAEHLPLLAWQPTLGHAGDPLLMPASVAGSASRWGARSQSCAHQPPQAAAAEASLRAGADPSEWPDYLAGMHSRVAGALAVCAVSVNRARPSVPEACRRPCSVRLRHPEAVRLDLDARVRLAVLFARSEVVMLRHRSTVGHALAAPDLAAVAAAWAATDEWLARPWRDGANPYHGGGQSGAAGQRPSSEAGSAREEAADRPACVAGLQRLVEAVAGGPVPPSPAFSALRADLHDRMAPGAPLPSRGRGALGPVAPEDFAAS